MTLPIDLLTQQMMFPFLAYDIILLNGTRIKAHLQQTFFIQLQIVVLNGAHQYGYCLSKTIGSRQKLNSLSVPQDLEINGKQLNRVDFTKSLGVFIDENLTWSNHINAISKKISSGIGSIKRISRCVPPATLHNIYHGLVQSHFDYCSVVWGNCAKTLSDKLQRLQNRAVRVLTHSSYDADANQLLKELGWDNLETRRQKLKAEMVYKSLNGLAPNYLSSKFIQRSDVITSYNLRDSDNKLAIPLPRTNHYKNSFAYSGAVLWNSLPSAARQATSLTNFRRFLINSDTAFM